MRPGHWEQFVEIELQLLKPTGAAEGLTRRRFAVQIPAEFRASDLTSFLSACFRHGVYNITLETENYGRLYLVRSGSP